MYTWAAAGDFWETRGSLPVEPLNAVLDELSTWTEAGLPMLMLVGNVRVSAAHAPVLVPEGHLCAPGHARWTMCVLEGCVRVLLLGMWLHGCRGQNRSVQHCWPCKQLRVVFAIHVEHSS